MIVAPVINFEFGEFLFDFVFKFEETLSHPACHRMLSACVMSHTHCNTMQHTHIYVYIYIYVYVCVLQCVAMCVRHDTSR